jgi:N-acetylglucosamine-6-phosphate deacetylase
MICKASYFNSAAGLHIETWCGLDKNGGVPKLVCAIDDTTDARHFVEVTNVKTYSRKVYAKGIIENFDVNSNAEFAGSTLKYSHEWEEARILKGSAPHHAATLNPAQIVKKSKGHETIKVEVGYEDLWNPGRLKRGDDPHNPILFSIDLI